jgi:hypothetical protein
MMIGIVSKNSTTILAHRFNSRRYYTYWKDKGVHFTLCLGVLCYFRGGEQESKIFSLLSSFLKIKGLLRDHLAVCLSLCTSIRVCPP